MHQPPFVSFSLSISALICLGLTCVALTTNEWIKEVEDHVPHSGLWADCDYYGCTMITPSPVHQGVIAFLIIAMIGQLVATCGFFTQGLINDTKSSLVAVIAFVFAAIAVFIAMATYTAYKNKEVFTTDLQYGYSYVFGWVSCVLTWTWACASLFFHRRNSAS